MTPSGSQPRPIPANTARRRIASGCGRYRASEIEEAKNESSDTIFTLMPTVVGMLIVVTDRVKARIASIVYSKIGKLGQRAIERKRELDGLLVLDGFTTSLCGAGSTLTSGHITAAESRIRANSTEPWDGPVAGVLHTYQVKDLKDEIAGGIGTYPVPEGLSARVFQDGSIKWQVCCVLIVDDNYIAIDSADDAKGGVFASGPGGAIVHVQGRAPWTKEQYNHGLGGGATEYYHYDEYIFGERSAGNWGFEIYSDATTPTS